MPDKASISFGMGPKPIEKDGGAARAVAMLSLSGSSTPSMTSAQKHSMLLGFKSKPIQKDAGIARAVAMLSLSKDSAPSKSTPGKESISFGMVPKHIDNDGGAARAVAMLALHPSGPALPDNVQTQPLDPSISQSARVDDLLQKPVVAEKTNSGTEKAIDPIEPLERGGIER